MAHSNSSNFKPADNLLRQWFSQMHEFKNNGTFCDITLKAGNKEIQAHRVILAASIPFFSRMLQSNFQENRKKKVEIKEIMDPDILENLINVSYGVELDINRQNAEKLLVGADYLQLDHVKIACKDFYKSHLSPERVLETKKIAEKFHCPELVSATEEFIDNNFSLIAKTNEFMELEKHELVEIIKRDELKAKEEEVYEAVMKWIKYEGPERIALLPEVLSYVRLCLLSPDYISNVAKENLIRVSLECRDLLEEAMMYHLMGGRNSLKTIRNTPRNFISLIYILGGQNNNRLVPEVLIYNLQEDKWVIDKNGIEIKFAASAEFGGKLYVFGGFKNNKEFISGVKIYDCKSKKVTQGAQMTLKFGYSAAAVLDGDIYLCGGCDGPTHSNFVQRYSPENNTWTEVSPLNQTRSGATAVALNNCVYVMGGYCGGSSYLNSCEKYDPESNSWTYIKPMLTPRNLAASAILDNKIFVCGGKSSPNVALDSVEIYDPVSNTWTFGTPMNVKRSNLALVSYNGKLYAIGGYDYSIKTSLSSAEIFDPVTNAWNFMASLPEPIFGMSFGIGFN